MPTEIQDLPANGAITDSELLLVRQGTTDVKVSVADLLTGSGVLDGLIQTAINDMFRGTVVASYRKTPDTGWLTLDGGSYIITQYQDLYDLVLAEGLLGAGLPFTESGPNFTLPDFRGQFIRGWDPTGTIDIDRLGLSGNFGYPQGHAIENITGDFGWVKRLIGSSSTGTGAFALSQTQGSPDSNNGSSTADRFDFDASRVVATSGNETRPKNVALNYFIKY